MRSRVLGAAATLAPLAVAILLATSAHRASAQTKIPYELTTADAPLSSEDKQQLKAFIQPRIQDILAANQPQLSNARRELLEPLGRAGVSENFLQAYSSTLAQQLQPAISSPNALVKLNAVVLAASLVGPEVVDIIAVSLADPNPAVSYWAAKAASNISQHSPLPEPKQRVLLDALVAAIKTLPPDPVFERLLAALAALNIPDASIHLLHALDLRLPLLAKDPSHPLGATIHSLQSIFVGVVRRTSSGQPAPPATIRHMTLVSYRYFDLMADILDSGANAPATESQCIKLLDLANRVLPWAVTQIDPAAKLPPPIEMQLASKTWSEIRLRAEEWRHLLTTHPFNFTSDDLTPPAPNQDPQ